MGRVSRVSIRGFRSIDDWIDVRIPEDKPVVLVGENNAGKSNILGGMDLLLGERWRGNYTPEDHEVFGRDPANRAVTMIADTHGVTKPWYGDQLNIAHFKWEFADGETSFLAITDDGEAKFMSYEVKNQCLCVMMGADRRIQYELSYASQFTLLSKIMKRFHNRLVADEGRVQELKAHFDEIVRLFRGVEEFDGFEKTLRNEIDSLAANLRYPLDVDFSAYDPSNFFHALRIRPRDEQGARTFDELGTGQEQLLALSLLYAYAQAFGGPDAGILLLLEEPEAHLHPLAQRWLARRLHDYVDGGIQVVLTTHSPAFLNLLDIEGLVLVRKDAETHATTTTQLTADALAQWCIDHGAPASVNAETILPFYETAATEEIKAGFLARAICLVEGASEALALPEYCRRLGFDPDEHGLAIIPVQGVGNLAKWKRLFTAYGIPTYVIFDNDTSDDASGDRRTDLLNTIGVPEGQHQAVMTTEDLAVHDGWAVMGVNFEQCLQRYFGVAYTELDEDAKAAAPGNSGKPLRARAVAVELPLDDPEAEGRERLDQLVRALETHAIQGAGQGA